MIRPHRIGASRRAVATRRPPFSVEKEKHRRVSASDDSETERGPIGRGTEPDETMGTRTGIRLDGIGLALQASCGGTEKQEAKPNKLHGMSSGGVGK